MEMVDKLLKDMVKNLKKLILKLDQMEQELFLKCGETTIMKKILPS